MAEEKRKETDEELMERFDTFVRSTLLDEGNRLRAEKGYPPLTEADMEDVDSQCGRKQPYFAVFQKVIHIFLSPYLTQAYVKKESSACMTAGLYGIMQKANRGTWTLSVTAFCRAIRSCGRKHGFTGGKIDGL